MQAVVDKRTALFYRMVKWRNWKFRMYCQRKASESQLINRIKQNYGANCTIYYDDWSRRDQMKGCSPSSVNGMYLLISRNLKVKMVDKFWTWKACSVCHEMLSCYRTRNGKLSHSRLFCQSHKCARERGKRRHFMDRDLNALANIILVASMSDIRPEHLRMRSTWRLQVFFLLESEGASAAKKAKFE